VDPAENSTTDSVATVADERCWLRKPKKVFEGYSRSLEAARYVIFGLIVLFLEYKGLGTFYVCFNDFFYSLKKVNHCTL
jgi:hypothetical protein